MTTRTQHHERAGLARKREQVAALESEFAQSRAVLLADYRGLNVATMQRLRRRLREAGASFQVSKNTLMQRAATNRGVGAMTAMLEGPTAAAFVSGDPVVAARALVEFARENRLPLVVKGGLLGNRVLASGDVERLAWLPSREVLLGQVASAIASPLSGLVTVLGGVPRKLVMTLDALRQARQESAG